MNCEDSDWFHSLKDGVLVVTLVVCFWAPISSSFEDPRKSIQSEPPHTHSESHVYSHPTPTGRSVKGTVTSLTNSGSPIINLWAISQRDQWE
jgi:hypothetical protein